MLKVRDQLVEELQAELQSKNVDIASRDTETTTQLKVNKQSLWMDDKGVVLSKITHYFW